MSGRKTLPSVAGLVGKGVAPGVVNGEPPRTVRLASFARSGEERQPQPQISRGKYERQDDPLGAPLELDVKLLDDSPDQYRIVYDEDELLSLAEQLKHGQVEPIIVRAKGDGRWELISGHRRKRAALLGGIETLKAIVSATVDDTECAFNVLIANESRVSASDFERALGYKRRIDAGDSQSEVARRLGIHRSLVSLRMGYFKLPSEVIAALHHTPGAFSHHLLQPLLDIFAEAPDLAADAADGIVQIGSGEWRPETLISTLRQKMTRRSAQAHSPARPGPVSVLDRENKTLLTIKPMLGKANRVEIALPVGMNSATFSLALSKLLQDHLEAVLPEAVEPAQ